MDAAANYEYDVFISYPNGYLFTEWVTETFLPLFELYLTQEMNRPVSLFFDRTGIVAGEIWPQKLRRAIVLSRCLVGIWAPSYFFSHWCAAEASVMIYRAQKLGYGTFDQPGGLVLPVVVFDGDNFPPFAKPYQGLDCRKFFRIGKGFVSTSRYVKLQDAMIDWIPGVASAVRNAPPWQSAWREEEWLTKPQSLFPPIPTPKSRPVTLW